MSFSDKMQTIGIASAVAALLLQLNVVLEDVEIRRATLVNQYWQTIRDTQGRYALGNQRQISAVEQLAKMREIDMTGVNPSSLFFGGARIEFARFLFSDLYNTNFRKAYPFRSQSMGKYDKNGQFYCRMSSGVGADLRFSIFNGADFSEAILPCSNFGRAAGSTANFFKLSFMAQSSLILA